MTHHFRVGRSHMQEHERVRIKLRLALEPGQARRLHVLPIAIPEAAQAAQVQRRPGPPRLALSIGVQKGFFRRFGAEGFVKR